MDGTILLSTWATWGFKKGGIRGQAYPWAGFCLFSLLSIAGNILHAWLAGGGNLPQWAAMAVMAVPPCALMYSTHLIVIIAGDCSRRDERQRDRAARFPHAAGTDLGGHPRPTAS